MIKRTLLIFLLLFPLILSCSQTVDKSKNQAIQNRPTTAMKATYIVTRTTEYYTTSPAQARPADGTFEAGTKVRLINRAGSYVLVETVSGISAYIASSALKAVEK